MKIEKYTNKDLLIYINSDYFKENIWEDRDLLIKAIKTFIMKIKNNYLLNIKGFYKVIVYPNKDIGTFIRMEKLEDYEYPTIDLRIIVKFNELFYFSFINYDDIPLNTSYIYYDDIYYVDSNEIRLDTNIFDKCRITYYSLIEDKLYKGKKGVTIPI